MSLFGKKTTKVQNDKKEKDTKSVSMKDMYLEDKAIAKSDTTKAEHKSKVSRAYRVLLKPLVSEKASHQQTLANQYFFAVDKKANKIELAKAIKAAYGIMPVKVNIIRLEGKKVRRGRIFGQRKDWKKAIVTLPKGKTITLYEGV